MSSTAIPIAALAVMIEPISIQILDQPMNPKMMTAGKTFGIIASRPARASAQHHHHHHRDDGEGQQETLDQVVEQLTLRLVDQRNDAGVRHAHSL